MTETFSTTCVVHTIEDCEDWSRDHSSVLARALAGQKRTPGSFLVVANFSLSTNPKLALSALQHVVSFEA